MRAAVQTLLLVTSTAMVHKIWLLLRNLSKISWQKSTVKSPTGLLKTCKRSLPVPVDLAAILLCHQLRVDVARQVSQYRFKLICPMHYLFKCQGLGNTVKLFGDVTIGQPFDRFIEFDI